MAKNFSDLFSIGGDHTEVFPGKISFENELSYREDGTQEFHESAELFGNKMEIYTTKTGELSGHLTTAIEMGFSDVRELHLTEVSYNGDKGEINYTFTSPEITYHGYDNDSTEVIFSRSEDGNHFSIEVNGRNHSELEVNLNHNDNGELESFKITSFVDNGMNYEDYSDSTTTADVKIDGDGYTVLYDSSGNWGLSPFVEEDRTLMPDTLDKALSDIDNEKPYHKTYDTFDASGSLVSREIHSDMSASDALKNPLYDFLEKTVIHYDNGEIKEIETCKFDRETVTVEHTYSDADGKVDRIEIVNTSGEIVDVIDGDELQVDKEPDGEVTPDYDISTKEGLAELLADCGVENPEKMATDFFEAKTEVEDTERKEKEGFDTSSIPTIEQYEDMEDQEEPPDESDYEDDDYDDCDD